MFRTVILAATLVAGCSKSKSAHPAAERAVPVQIARVEQRDLPIWIEGLGTVAAFQQVTVHPQVDGRLDKVLFTEGQTVKAGDVIAQIDPRPFEVQLHQAQGALDRDKAQLDAAQKNAARYKELEAQKLVAAQQVEQTVAQAGNYAGAIKVDEAAIESAKLNLDYARVKLDGVRVEPLSVGGASILSSTTRADGFVVIPDDSEGFPAGADVDVWLYA